MEMTGTLARSAAIRFRAAIEAAWPGRILDVRIFGSMARGEARPDSDLDVFVMVDERDPAINEGISNAAWDVSYGMELPFPISPRIMARAHFEELLRRERRIAVDIWTEGIVV